MAKVELIYHTSCPNLKPAREALETALDELNMKQEWVEWNSDDASAPDYARQYGSPTILVNGRDVGKEKPTGSSSCCRLYDLGGGQKEGIPTIDMIKKELSL